MGFGKIAESTHVPALAAAGLDLVAVAEADASRRRVAQDVLRGARIYADLDALDDLVPLLEPDFEGISRPKRPAA